MMITIVVIVIAIIYCTSLGMLDLTIAARNVSLMLLPHLSLSGLGVVLVLTRIIVMTGFSRRLAGRAYG